MSSAAFVKQLLLGLEEAFDDLRQELGDSGAPLRLLSNMGWTVPDGTDIESVKEGFSALGQALDAVATTAQSLEALPDEASLEDYAPVLAAMADVVAETVVAIHDLAEIDPSSLPAPFSNEGLWAHFAEQVVDLLLIRYLDRHQHQVSGILRFIGVIVEDWQPPVTGRDAFIKRTFDWNRLGNAFTKPGDIMADVYQWGGAFDSVRFIRNLGSVCAGFGLSPATLAPRDSLADLYYAPTNPLRPSVNQLAVPIYWERDPNNPTSGVLAVDLKLGVLPIPPAANHDAAPTGFVLFPSLAGAAAVTFELTDSVDFAIEGAFQAALARLDVYPDAASFNVLPLAADFSGSAAIVGKPDEPWVLIGRPASTRLELSEAHIKIAAKGTTATIEFIIEGGIDSARVVVQLDESDGFLTKVLGTDPIEVPFALVASWSSKTGLRVEGEIGISLRIPLNLSIGGVFSLDALYIELSASTSGAARVILAVAASLKIGPFAASVDRIGMALDLVPRASSDPPGNLGPLDLRFGFKPPDGAGMVLDAGPVTGGGYLFFDPDNEQYAGILQLSFKTIGITAIGLLTTRLPDPAGPPGSTKKGFSLLIIITVDLPPIQLGYGFTLNGVGGLLGVNRTVVVDVLRDGVRNRTVDAILFPHDPIARATEIISTLRSVFPPAEGRFVFGPMVKLGWGPNSLIELEAAVILELMSPIRLIILGRIQLALPDKKDPVLNLRLDMAGVLDFDRNEASVDASLIDSRIAVFAITGDMAVRVGWGATKIFVMAAGGFHPRFQPPAGFPVLRRLAITLADSDNPRIRLDTYLALTSNTFQMGAGVEVYAKADTFAGTFSVQALMNFDALIQFQPFTLAAELGASIDICRDDVPVLHAAIHATLTGPGPWHMVGFAEFDCLGKHRIDVEATIGDPQPADPILMAASQLFDDLVTAFGRADAWAALPPVQDDRIVTLCDQPAGDRIRIHPLGALIARQRVVPLNKVIERFGSAIVPATTFSLNGFKVGLSQMTKLPAEYLQDDFAPGQFTPMTDDEKLARPAFEAMRSGGRVAVDAFLMPTGAGVSVPSGQYEESIVDDDPVTGTRVAKASTISATIPAATFSMIVSGGAAAHAATRRSGAAQFAAVPIALGVEGERYVAANANTLARDPRSGQGTSAAEAHDVLAATSSGSPAGVALTCEAA